ncbi:hypothetical protein AB1Y20_020336 [Prymnesium parvum]|uniref:Uncharacterized protein n=1 Tax=Prymnesium parvum TaxID=97485 RepID=A0AB34JUD5_PRYPA
MYAGHIDVLQDALDAADRRALVPPRALQLVEEFATSTADHSDDFGRLWSDPTDPATAYGLFHERSYQEHEYDGMVEQMTARAWKRAWEAYTIRSNAANQAGFAHRRRLQEDQAFGGGQMEDGRTASDPATYGATSSSQFASRRGGALATFDGFSCEQISSYSRSTRQMPPSSSEDLSAARAREACAMASASLLAHPAVLASSEKQLQLTSSLGAARGKPQRNSSYLEAHRVKSAQKHGYSQRQ